MSDDLVVGPVPCLVGFRVTVRLTPDDLVRLCGTRSGTSVCKMCDCRSRAKTLYGMRYSSKRSTCVRGQSVAVFSNDNEGHSSGSSAAAMLKKLDPA